MKGFVWCAHCGSPHALEARSCPTTGHRLTFGNLLAKHGLARGARVADRFTIAAWLAEEGASVLYDARDGAVGRRVVLKLVQEPVGDKSARIVELAATKREHRAAIRVEHPHVASVLAYGEIAPGEAYLAREALAGRTMATVLRESGAMPLDQVGELMEQLLSGLDAIHGAGIVHGDLETRCILLVDRAGLTPLVRVGGLGRCARAKDLDITPMDRPCVHYAAPELVNGGYATVRSDLFSCGAILYEMVTGRRPFEAADEDDVAAAVVSETPPQPSQLRPGLAAEWSVVLARALSKDPAARYETALELQAALPTHRRPRAKARSRAVPHAISSADTHLAVADDSAPVSSAAPTSRRGALCDPFVGRVLASKYKLHSLLGSGTAGAVYRATHIGLDRTVAVKVLHDWNRGTSQYAERFKTEAQMASRLDHANATRVLDFGQERDGTLYLVMEYVHGETLESLLASEGRLEPHRAVNIAMQIASALSAAHDIGVVHRDVKPANVVVATVPVGDGTFDDLVKVCDFGLAKIEGQEREDLSSGGRIFGTPAYMAPEQVRGEPVTPQCDVYSTGVVLFEMLSAALPHDATDLPTLFNKKVNDAPRQIAELVDPIDPLLEDVVMHAISSAPSGRQASARVLRGELIEVLNWVREAPSGTMIVLDDPA